MNTALILANSAACLALLALCVVVLFFMDPRQLRIGTIALGLCVAVGAAWLLASPGIDSKAPSPFLVAAAAGVAILGWVNVRRLIEFATEPVRHVHPRSHVGALTLAVACMLAPALTGCAALNGMTGGGSLLDAEGFPKRYVAILDGITQARQAAALAVIAGALKPADALKKMEELDKAAAKLSLDRMVRAINTPEMDAALEKDKQAQAAVAQALAAVAPPK